MPAVSASTAIGAKSAAGEGVQSARNRIVAPARLAVASDAAATPGRGRDVATSSANGAAGGADVALLSHPKDLSNALRMGQDEAAGQQQPTAKHKKTVALPSSKGSPLKFKSVRHKEAHITVRRKPSSFWDLTGHLFSRIFLIFVIGAGLGSSWWNWKTRPQLSNSRSVIITEVEKLEEFVAKTAKSMQDQLDAVDTKIGHEVGAVKKDLHKGLDSHRLHVDTELKNVKAKVGKFGDTLNALIYQGGGITQKEALALIEEVVDKRAAEGKGTALSLDDVRTAARQVVLRELERHSADGIGRVDYALGSGGGRVIAHSEGYYVGSRADWRTVLGLLPGSDRTHAFAQKILQPSFGEPGQCLPLKGSNVWVDISLRTTIRPDAITLEHISKDNAYDISSAPKEFRLFGWLEARGQRDLKNPVTMMPFGEFTYDTAKASVQTFSLSEEDVAGSLISMIRLHVLSNYGSPTHTCIYRVRMHGSDQRLV